MWFAFLPCILLAMAAVVGLILLVCGLWGRRVALAGPHCRKCGYNLTHLPSDRCPECGSIVALTGVVTSCRQRRPVLLLTGLFLLSAALAVPVGLGKRGLQNLNIYCHKPTSWVLRDTQSSNWRLATNAYYELQGRVRSGSVDNVHRDEFIKSVVADFTRKPRRDDPVHNVVVYILGWLIQTRQLTPEQERLVLDQLLDVTMEASPTAVRSSGIPVTLRVRNTGEFPAGVDVDRPVLQMARAGQQPQSLPLPPAGLPELTPRSPFYDGVLQESLIRQPFVLSSLSISTNAEYTSEMPMAIITGQTGPCQLNFAVSIDFYFYSQPTTAPTARRYIHRLTRAFALTSEVLADPIPDHPRLTVRREVYEPVVRPCMRVKAREVPASQPADRDKTRVVVELQATNPPLALGFTVAAEILESAYPLGNFVAFPADRTDWHGEIKIPGPTPDHVTIVLTPNASLLAGRAYETCGDASRGGGELRFEQVPLVRSPARSNTTD